MNVGETQNFFAGNPKERKLFVRASCMLLRLDVKYVRMECVK